MDFQSINPPLWGPGAWTFIHYVALAYPNNPTEEEKKNYYNFYYNLQNILPCPKCRENYKENLNTLPLEEALGNKELLFKWTIDIHNEVNKETNKSQFTYEEAISKYTKTEKSKYYNIICGIALTLLILLTFVFLKKKL